MKERIEGLLARMTLEQKAAMVTGKNDWETEQPEGLELPGFWMSDGPHGLRKQDEEGVAFMDGTPAVSFPAECLTAASFDRKLLYTIGAELGKEAQGRNVQLVLGPGINIKRSPLCGRNFEYMSEDPVLAGELAVSYVEGIQDQGVGACVKHFLGNNQETRRMSSSSNINERTLREIYLPAFERVIQKARPWAVMSSYNLLNGVQMTENREYQTKVLRDEWGFDGCVISDWGATHDLPAAVEGGCDLSMPAQKQNIRNVIYAVEEGTLSEETLDEACAHVIGMIMRGSDNHKEGILPEFEKGHLVAVKAAEESAILLKNDNQILPLEKEQKIVFIGDFAERPRYQGGGSSQVNALKVTSPLEEARKITEITYCKGYRPIEGFRMGTAGSKGEQPDEELIAEACRAAVAADRAVIFAGLPEPHETEGMDRFTMEMPLSHNALIEAVAKVQPNTVVVLFNGSPVEMPWADRVSAILEMYLPGEGVGEATTNLLFGITNPSGRLPETFPIRLQDNPSYPFFPGTLNETDYTEGIYVGYRYYETRELPVRFPFGYGLSYTKFRYSDLRVDDSGLSSRTGVKVSVDVENTGERPGKEVVQLYLAVKECYVKRPRKELKDFCKISLLAGEKKTVSFELTKKDFSYWNEQIKEFHMAGGIFLIQIGSSSRDVLLEEAITVEEEAIDRGMKISLQSPVGDLAVTAPGMRFLKENLMNILHGTIRFGMQWDALTGVATDDTETYEKVLAENDLIKSLSGQSIDVLRMFLPEIADSEWQSLFEQCNME